MEKAATAGCFSPHIFWDCNAKALDLDRDKEFIIERALTRGLEKDEKLVFAIYGAETIKNTVINIKNMDRKIGNYLSVILNIPRENFKYYTEKQWNRSSGN